MDVWMDAIGYILQPGSLLTVIFGVVAGMVIGALPGMTSTMGVAIFIPFTFGMDPRSGLLLLAAIYCSSVFGGSIAAILVNTPGTPAGAATVLDGFELTKQGKSGLAIGMAAIASFVGGIVSALVLSTVAPVLARWALRFGPPEYFALSVFGMSVVSALVAKYPIKGFIAGVFGLLVATVGMDPVYGWPRFTFDTAGLLAGFALIPVLIGLFAASQAFDLMSRKDKGTMVETEVAGQIIPSWSELKRLSGNIVRSAFIGTGVGIIPGVGGDPAAFIAYNEAVRWSKHPEKFGTGILDGVAAPEASNNGVTGGSLVPLLTLGIPGNAVSAVFLGGLLIHGLRPGPALFTQSGDIVRALFAGLFLINILMLVVGLSSARLAPKLLRIPTSVLAPLILILSIVGSYAINKAVFDVGVMLAFGVIGYLFKVLRIPPAPAVLAIILEPIMEHGWRQSMIMLHGNWVDVLARPIVAVFLLLALITAVTPFLRRRREDVEKSEGAAV